MVVRTGLRQEGSAAPGGGYLNGGLSCVENGRRGPQCPASGEFAGRYVGHAERQRALEVGSMLYCAQR